MFRLEAKIAEWRRQMLAAGIKKPVPLEELESHLREDVERQIRTGLDAQQAFEIAVARIGDGKVVHQEFKKVALKQRMNMIRVFAIVLAFFGMMLGQGLVLPQLGMWSRTGVLHSPAALTMGMVMVLLGGIAAFQGIRTMRSARGRRLINIAIIGAAVFHAMPIIIAFFNETNRAGWIFCGLLAVVSLCFFGSCFYLNKRVSVTTG